VCAQRGPLRLELGGELRILGLGHLDPELAPMTPMDAGDGEVALRRMAHDIPSERRDRDAQFVEPDCPERARHERVLRRYDGC
jgi:hypothetical protein